MNTFLLFAIPIVVVIVGMILNNLGSSSFDQPGSSPEQDPLKRLTAEREIYRKFFDLQRTRFFKRQKRTGAYAWLVLAVFVVSFLWLYFDTINRTTDEKQIAALQTLAAEKTNETVLTVTLRDGNRAKYLIKRVKAGTADGAAAEGFSKESISDWELSNAGTALNIGDGVLPLGIALKISQ